MSSKALQEEFDQAVDCVSNHQDPFPADVLLNLYAYYKRAHNDYDRPSSGRPLITAFKTNALFQTRHLSPEEAKQAYIDLAKRYFDSLDDC